MPDHTLSDLLKIFMSTCTLDDGQYFMCKFDEILALATLIDYYPIKIKAKYTFACAPISASKNQILSSCFLRFVRSYSQNEAVTIQDLKKTINWSQLKVPLKYEDMAHMENIYDVLDLYLWLGFRFPDIFSYADQVKEMRIELEQKIEEGVEKILDLRKERRSLINKKIKTRLSIHDLHASESIQNKRETSEPVKAVTNKQTANTTFEGKLNKIEVDSMQKISILKKETARLELANGLKADTKSSDSKQTVVSKKAVVSKKSEQNQTAKAIHQPSQEKQSKRVETNREHMKKSDPDTIKLVSSTKLPQSMMSSTPYISPIASDKVSQDVTLNEDIIPQTSTPESSSDSQDNVNKYPTIKENESS